MIDEWIKVKYPNFARHTAISKYCEIDSSSSLEK